MSESDERAIGWHNRQERQERQGSGQSKNEDRKSEIGNLVGQDRASRLLEATLKADLFPPLLFAGPAGTGKRTAALRLAQTANCSATVRPCGRCSSCVGLGRLQHPDIKMLLPIRLPRGIDPQNPDKSIELVAEETIKRYEEYAAGQAQPVPEPKHAISIWQVRWLRREMARPPLLVRRRFFIVLHAHRMTAEAANAFLKTLEEPQRQTAIVLTTDRPSLLFDTIRSRCRLVRFSALSPDSVRQWLVANRAIKPEEAELAALVADGSLGKALRFAHDPDDFLAGPALDFFALRSAGEKDVLTTMAELDKTPLSTVVFTLLFLFRQVLLSKLGLETGYARHNPAVRRKAQDSELDYLRRATDFLAGRLEDCRLNINRRLFLYSLLSAVRKRKEA